MKVGIIGAGIGGACLAHGLRKEGIDVKVFERNSIARSGLAGYGIHINVFGQQAMQECLPDANWQDFIEAAKPIGGKARFFDEKLRLLTSQDGIHVKEGLTVQEERLSISRTELINILNDGLGDVVQRERTFTRYEIQEYGQVRIFFSDGGHEDVDVLVGADGANSKVRKQVLPTIERFEVGVKIIVGRTALTPELRIALPEELIDGSPNSVVPVSTDWMFVSVWRAPIDTTPANARPEVGTFVVWAYIAANDSYPSDLDEWPPDRLTSEVMGRTQGWNSVLHELISRSDLGSVSVVPLRSMPHLPAWKAGQVTLLGDAIHNMTPMAGVGANTALRDARLLTRALAFADLCQADPTDSIAEYEEEMRGYANKAVALSLRNAQNAVNPSKFKRHFFRGLLRTAQAAPILKRVLFPAGR